MAYNVLKGIVEGSVDQYGDQEIDGVKIFKNTVSASVFYDTDAQSPCATMKDVAITNIVGGGEGCLLTLENENTARANYNLTFDGNKLTTKLIYAEQFHGSAENLTKVPTNQFVGKIKGDSISVGGGLCSIRGDLQINAGAGITTDDGELSVKLSNTGGLSLRNSRLTIDPDKTDSIKLGGQNLSDNDLLIVSDTSHNNVAHTTLLNFYEGYIKNKTHLAAGAKGDLQIKDHSGLASTPKLSYDTSSDTLKVDGKINTDVLKVNKALQCEGAIYANINTIESRIYETQAGDYTLLCDTKQSPVTVMLPPACNNAGRIINVKKASSDKYKINSYPVILKVSEGTIDLTDEVTIKTNYSSRTVQSDGNAWWIISSKGN